MIVLIVVVFVVVVTVQLLVVSGPLINVFIFVTEEFPRKSLFLVIVSPTVVD